MKKIRVLIIDDSALVRQMLTEFLSADPAIEVVGVAADPYIAREQIKDLNPDVLTLDVEMPRMDGLTFLRNLMRLHPMRVVMVSSLTASGAEVTLEALELGALDYVSKPRIGIAEGLKEYRAEIVDKVKAAAAARIGAVEDALQRAEVRRSSAVRTRPALGASFRTTNSVLAIGASTGGTEAILELISSLPGDTPGTVITQHIPAAFSEAFARRVDASSSMTVQEAEDGRQILSGHAYVAPGDRHLLVEKSGTRYICRVNQDPPVNRHRPSVDVMFGSVARSVGRNGVGVLLTGMGQDGAVGLGEMRAAGARTIAQDERTSVVWGMPRAAVRMGAAESVLPLQGIPGKILNLMEEDRGDHV